MKGTQTCVLRGQSSLACEINDEKCFIAILAHRCSGAVDSLDLEIVERAHKNRLQNTIAKSGNAQIEEDDNILPKSVPLGVI